jgi:S1-C subfamily serine protease
MASSSVMQSLSNELSSIAEQVGPSVVAVRGRHRMFSSGIQWRKGVIVTADHAIGRDENVTVVVERGTSIQATVAGRDPSTDLAVLKIDESTLALAPTSEGGAAKLGEIVLALGRSLRGNVVASAGIIGGVGGEWRTWRGGHVDQQIRLDLELYPGFSGGPLVEANGTIVGINSRGLARGRAVSIPVSTVNKVVDKLLEKGHIAKPYLGLAMQPVAIPEQLRSRTQPSRSSGLLVVHVDPGAPAEQAGILLGDVLLEIHGKALGDMETLRDLIGSGKVGDKLTVNLLRGGKAQTANVTLADRPGK